MSQFSRSLVSIGLVTHNRAALLDAALSSLAAQDYPNIEIVVSDNASADGTESVVRRYAALNPRLRYHRSPTDTGPVQNLRRALLLARGEYFMWAADDDLWSPNFVSRLVSELESMQGVVLAMCEAQYIDPEGNRLPPFTEGGWFHRCRRSDRTTAYVAGVAIHSYGNLFYGVYRTSVLRADDGSTVLDVCRSNPFSETPVFVQVAVEGRISVIDDVLFFKRAPVTTYAQAAAEKGAWPVVAIPYAPSGRRRARVVSRIARSLIADARFHWGVLRDSTYAIARTRLEAPQKVGVVVVACTWLVVHLIRVQVLKLRLRLRARHRT